jgi:hypothetical protein
MFTFFFTCLTLSLSCPLISLSVSVAKTRIKVFILIVQSLSLFSPFIYDFAGATLGEFFSSLFQYYVFGEGNFGKVKFAKNIETGQSFAVKILEKNKIIHLNITDQVLHFFIHGIMGVLQN